jgi:hypothetical protein
MVAVAVPPTGYAGVSGSTVTGPGQALQVPSFIPSASCRKAEKVTISVGPWGFLLSRMATRRGRGAISTQLLPPPEDLVLLRQVAAERSAGAVGFMVLGHLACCLREAVVWLGVRAAAWSLANLSL